VPAEKAPWLLLIHQIPTKPDYLRVKVGRRLQQIGAVAVKSTVYALPNRESCRENFEWVLREILGGGGEALLCAVELVGGLDPEGLRELFVQARSRDYQEIAEEAGSASERWDVGGQPEQPGERRSLAAVLGRLERRLAATRAIDYFAAPESRVATASLASLRERLLEPREPPRPEAEIAARARGRVWVTRAGVEEDRIASAWLIRRFIDPEASFRFVTPDSPRLEGELRFDMYDGEYTHDGDRCTFEVLLDRFELRDEALEALAQIVHDVDLKDEKFGRPETGGFERFVQGLARVEPGDTERIAHGAIFLEALYAAFGGKP
jgi:hypothetical protein